MNEFEKKAITEAFDQVTKTILSVNTVVDMNVEELKKLDKRLSNVENLLANIAKTLEILESVPNGEINKE